MILFDDELFPNENEGRLSIGCRLASSLHKC